MSSLERNKYDTSRNKVPLQVLEARIKGNLRAHLHRLGFAKNGDGQLVVPCEDKQSIRLSHSAQRRERLREAGTFLKTNLPRLINYFASGTEVVPERILPSIELIEPGTREADLFRIASFTWSIPVSRGYGRRMRFLIWDKSNRKLVGILALGDPVFNLRVRDQTIKWGADVRKERLVNMMDAYVVGALPPYNMLLGGKLVACLIRSQEVRDAFKRRYANTCGLISGKEKHAQLVLVSTSSALGRSSMYNRLRLNGLNYFESVGYTSGYGHFHISSNLFDQMRAYLRRRRHPYSKGHDYGDGPNWKLRAIRATLELMGVDRNLLRHGIKREVFICRLARNADDVLRGGHGEADYGDLLTAADVGKLALHRWLCPRAQRKPEFRKWSNQEMLKLLSWREKS